MRELSIAIVGCGRIADAHAEILKYLEGARLTSCCDSELLMAEQLGMRYGVPGRYSSLEALLSVEKPDVVHITTPPASHLDLTRLAVAAGCHVLVEKPVAIDPERTAELIGVVEQGGRKLAAGHIYQFDPVAEKMRRIIASGAIGEPVHLESFYGYNLAGPFGASLLREPGHWVHRLPGKLLHNVIDHLVNKIAEFLPDDHPEIFATGSRHRLEGPPFHDEMRVVFRGADVTAYGTFSSKIRPDSQFLRVYGTRNSLLANYVSRTVVLDNAPTMPSMLGRLVPPFRHAWQYARNGFGNLNAFARSDFHFFAGLRTLLRRFYDAIRTDGPSPTPARDLIRTARFMDCIFKQLDSRP